MMKKMFALAALLAFAAAPIALAHDTGFNPGTGVSPNTGCEPQQNPHDYGVAGSARWETSAFGGSLGSYSAGDYNLEDCGGSADHDADFDGDYEFGRGGGFFPAGIYAADPLCDYGLVAHHGPNFHVHSAIPDEDATGFTAAFAVGTDPSPPTLVPSTDVEDDDGFDCFTDGSVTPNTDLDDCLEYFIHVGTTTCAPGSDGGYNVWIHCLAQTEGDDVSLGLSDTDGDGVPDSADPTAVPPSGADAHCSFAGHISST